MSMFEITNVLWRRRGVVCAVAAGLILIGVAVVFVGRSTTYEASSQVLIDQPDLLGTTGGASVPSKLATLGPTFCRLIEGDRAVAAIAAAADVTVDTVRSIARCQPIEGTTVIAVSATSASSQRAEAVAAAAADELARQIDDRYSGSGVPTREYIDASVLVSASSATPIDDHVGRQLALVAAFALLVAAAFAVAAEPHRRDVVVPVDEHRESANGAPVRVPAGRS